MRCAILLLVLLTPAVEAAPRLKDRQPLPDPEGARIAALKAKYAAVRASGQPDEKRSLDLAQVKVQVYLLVLDELADRPASSRARQEREVERELRADPVAEDLYDIAVYDRKKTAGGQ